MPSPSTHQDSPKVPWPALTVRRARGYENYNVLTNPDEFQQTPQEERETYVPVSALLSDEVVEAACARFERVLKDEEFDQFEFPESFMREALSAAIEQVGGDQVG